MIPRVDIFSLCLTLVKALITVPLLSAGRYGLVVKSRLRLWRVSGSKPDSTKEPPCIRGLVTFSPQETFLLPPAKSPWSTPPPASIYLDGKSVRRKKSLSAVIRHLTSTKRFSPLFISCPLEEKSPGLSRNENRQLLPLEQAAGNNVRFARFVGGELEECFFFFLFSGSFEKFLASFTW
ncbi:hypothetical protein AVEN_117961-1 [Araneus ventricosus]|uniref:Uncharacterized protein n=1 Tax=Araneus ventricosus TaxID=182803 RepID=A0A4Y2H612_ARAVE|nr:hypothetical protein AVEN_117961-1 [Araneus ventricosus]